MTAIAAATPAITPAGPPATTAATPAGFALLLDLATLPAATEGADPTLVTVPTLTGAAAVATLPTPSKGAAVTTLSTAGEGDAPADADPDGDPDTAPSTDTDASAMPSPLLVLTPVSAPMVAADTGVPATVAAQPSPDPVAAATPSAAAAIMSTDRGDPQSPPRAKADAMIATQPTIVPNRVNEPVSADPAAAAPGPNDPVSARISTMPAGSRPVADAPASQTPDTIPASILPATGNAAPIARPIVQSSQASPGPMTQPALSDADAMPQLTIMNVTEPPATAASEPSGRAEKPPVTVATPVIPGAATKLDPAVAAPATTMMEDVARLLAAAKASPTAAKTSSVRPSQLTAMASTAPTVSARLQSTLPAQAPTPVQKAAMPPATSGAPATSLATLPPAPYAPTVVVSETTVGTIAASASSTDLRPVTAAPLPATANVVAPAVATAPPVAVPAGSQAALPISSPHAAAAVAIRPGARRGSAEPDATELQVDTVATTTPATAAPFAPPPAMAVADSATATMASPITADAGLGFQIDAARHGHSLDAITRDIAATTAPDAKLAFRVDPQRLGPLMVEISRSEAGMSVRMEAGDDRVRTAIADQQQRLVTDAASAGVRIVETRVEAPRRDEAVQQQPGGTSQQAMSGQTGGQGSGQRAAAQPQPAPAWTRAGTASASSTPRDAQRPSARDLYA